MKYPTVLKSFTLAIEKLTKVEQDLVKLKSDSNEVLSDSDSEKFLEGCKTLASLIEQIEVYGNSKVSTVSNPFAN